MIVLMKVEVVLVKKMEMTGLICLSNLIGVIILKAGTEMKTQMKVSLMILISFWSEALAPGI